MEEESVVWMVPLELGISVGTMASLSVYLTYLPSLRYLYHSLHYCQFVMNGVITFSAQ